MQENLIEVGKWIGMNLLVYIKPVIQYTNAILLTIKELAKGLAELKQQTDNIDYTKEFANFGEAVESTTGVVDDLNQSMNELLGFDTLNVLGTSSSATSGLGVEQRILDELKEYSMILDNVNYKAKEISKKMLDWIKNTKSLSKVFSGIGVFLMSSSFFGILTKISATVGLGESGILASILKFAPALTTVTTILGLMYGSSEDFRESINSLISGLIGLLLPTMKLIFTVIESLMPVVDTIINLLVNILNPVIVALLPIIQMIGEVITSLIPFIQIIADILAVVISGAIQGIYMYVFSLIVPVIQFIVQLLSTGITTALGVIKTLIDYLVAITLSWGEVFKAIGSTIVGLFTGNFDMIVKAWENVGTRLKEIWGNVWDGIKSTFVTILNGIIQGFATFVNALSGIINGITSALSSVYEFTGIPAIPAIPEWNPELIALAKGGVINRPTTALVGEYANAKSNPEIVTPENLMRQVFLESMLPIAQAISSGNGEVVNAIEDLANRPIELNGRKVSENIYDDLQKVFLRKTGYKVNYGK